MAKIQIAALKTDKEGLLQFLQEEEVVHIEEEKNTGSPVESNTAYLLAQVQFGLEYIGRVRKRLHLEPKRNLKNIFASKPAADLPTLQQTFEKLGVDALLQEMQAQSDRLVELDAQVLQLEDRIAELFPWKALTMRGGTPHNSPIEHTLLIIHTHNESMLQEMITKIKTGVWQEIHREEDGKATIIYGELVTHQDDRAASEELLRLPGVDQVQLNLEVGELIADRLNLLQQTKDKAIKERDDILTQATSYFEKETELKYAYDALLHQQERENQYQNMGGFNRAIVLTGWIPKAWLPKFTKKFTATFPNGHVEEITIEESDKPPVTFTNNNAVKPFEAVTNIYGKPAYHELDPSGALGLFFLLAFGLALTDAGYGIVMAVGMFVADKFFRLKREMRKMVRLLMYAGLATILLGALTGGWFGVTLEELPPSGLKDFLLSMKFIDPIADPIALLFVALGLGILQLLFAWVVRGYDHWRNGNKLAVFLDDIPWITMVVFLLSWAGAKQGMLPASTQGILGWITVVNGAFLVLTQGRSAKNPFVKIGSGALSLYGLINFLSDTLSYSRLLALGLATAIIGLVVNLLAGMAYNSLPPALGFIIAGGVLLVGHVFNLGINALGAFIHSGRLQFVEFFPKFMEGGGRPYRPFGRVSRYVDNPKEFK